MANKINPMTPEQHTRLDNIEKAGAGKKFVREAREFKAQRKEWADKEVYQSAKEAASYLIGQSRGRVSVTIDPNDWERIFRRDKKHNG